MERELYVLRIWAYSTSGFELIFSIDKIDQRRECLVERDGRNVSGL